jgi:hypothetical protein
MRAVDASVTLDRLGASLINSVYVMIIYHHRDAPSEHFKQDPDPA